VNKRLNFTLRAALMTIAAAPAFGQYGGLDGTFTPFTSAGGLINSAVPHPDGSVILAGQFNKIRAVESDLFTDRYGIAKISNGGFVEAGYLPNVNATAWNTVIQPDGSAYVAGEFDKVNFINNVADPSTRIRYRMAKFDNGGTVDPGFVPQTSGLTSIFSMSPTTSGEMIIAAHGGLYKIKSNGTVADVPDFYSYPGFGVYGAAVMLDQKIVPYGPFGYPAWNIGGNGINSNYLDLLSQTGRYTVLGPAPYYPDAQPFSPQLNAAVHAVAVLPDGNLVVGGLFSSPSVGLTKIITQKGVLPADYAGRPDPAWLEKHQYDGPQPFIDGNVEAIAVQADGKILIGGGFTRVRGPVKVDGVWPYFQRYGIARLHADGSFDTTFNANIQPKANQPDSIRVLGISIQKDGKILMTGLFERIGPALNNYTYRPLIARLTNNEATESLTTNGSSITWLRGGASPEATSVIFEWRPSNSPYWQLVDNLGIAVRTAGGWTRTLQTPIPASSYIRASARTTGGRYNGSSGLVSTTIGYKVAAVSLMRDNPFWPLAHGGSTTFDNVGVSRSRDFSFTLTNTGDAAMSGISASVTGGNSNQFSVVGSVPTTLAIGASASIVVRFSPTTLGAKTTTLRINSNAPATPQFNVTLTGTPISEMEGFRYEYFGSTANSGNGADSADPDGDGQTNLFEFIAGLVPNDRNSKFEQRVDRSSGTPKVIFSPIVAGRTYEVQTTTTLANNWVAATGGSTTNNGVERTYTHTGVTDPKRFYRIKITK
jgi:hypothetical protein